MHGHRGAERVRVRDDGHAAVVGHVEGLVGVGRPRVGVLRPREQVTQPRRGGRPHPDGPVHVHPPAALAHQRDQLLEAVVGTGVDVAGVQAHHERGALGHLRQGGDEVVHPHAAVLVHADGHRSAQAQEPESAVDGLVAVGAAEDVHPRGTLQPVRVQVPADRAQDMTAGRGQAREVGRHGTRDEPHHRTRGQAEQVQGPPLDGVLGRAGGGGQGPHPGVLVPGRRHHVRRHRSR